MNSNFNKSKKSLYKNLPNLFGDRRTRGTFKLLSSVNFCFFVWIVYIYLIVILEIFSYENKTDMEDYEDFLIYLNDSMVKLKELLEKVTTLHNEVAIGLLETSSLYNPQILLDITEMAVNGRKFDKYIMEGEEMKQELEKLLTMPDEVDIEEGQEKSLQDLELLSKSLAENFHLDINKI